MKQKNLKYFYIKITIHEKTQRNDFTGKKSRDLLMHDNITWQLKIGIEKEIFLILKKSQGVKKENKSDVGYLMKNFHVIFNFFIFWRQKFSEKKWENQQF